MRKFRDQSPPSAARDPWKQENRPGREVSIRLAPPPVPRMTARDHLESFIQYFLPVIAGSLIAVGLLIGWTTSWEESAAHDTAVAKTVFALVLIGCGAATFRYWKNRS